MEEGVLDQQGAAEAVFDQWIVEGGILGQPIEEEHFGESLRQCLGVGYLGARSEQAEREGEPELLRPFVAPCGTLSQPVAQVNAFAVAAVERKRRSSDGPQRGNRGAHKVFRSRRGGLSLTGREAHCYGEIYGSYGWNSYGRYGRY